MRMTRVEQLRRRLLRCCATAAAAAARTAAATAAATSHVATEGGRRLTRERRREWAARRGERPRAELGGNAPVPAHAERVEAGGAAFACLHARPEGDPAADAAVATAQCDNRAGGRTRRGGHAADVDDVHIAGVVRRGERAAHLVQRKMPDLVACEMLKAHAAHAQSSRRRGPAINVRRDGGITSSRPDRRPRRNMAVTPAWPSAGASSDAARPGEVPQPTEASASPETSDEPLACTHCTAVAIQAEA